MSILTPLLDLAQHPRSLIQIVVQSLSASQSTEYPEAGPSTAPSDQKSWPADSIDGESHAFCSAAPLASTPFSARAAAINAVTLSTLDAGSIAMRAVPVAVSVAFVPSRRRQNGFPVGSSAASGDDVGVMVLDPTPEEEQRASSRHGFCWAFGQGIAADPGANTGSGVKAEDDEDEEMIVYRPRADNSGLESADRTEAELVWVESEGSFDRQQVRSQAGWSRSTKTDGSFSSSRLWKPRGEQPRTFSRRSGHSSPNVLLGKHDRSKDKGITRCLKSRYSL